MTVRILVGDALSQLKTLDDESVQTCVTSPPYFGLRDYGVAGQLGLERTPDEYVAKMVAVFREVRRVLRKDGTLWLNVGDSYAGSGRGGNPPDSPHQKQQSNRGTVGLSDYRDMHDGLVDAGAIGRKWVAAPHGYKQKDLIGIPWMLAFALRADGWYLRSDIIWSKPNPMPESVTDRPTKAHEYVFLLSKSASYFYDAEAIAEPVTESTVARLSQDVESQVGSACVPGKTNGNMKAVRSKYLDSDGDALDPGLRTKEGLGGERFQGTLARIVERGTRNRRTVWDIEATGNRERECLTIIDSSLSTADKWDAIKAMMSGAQSDVWRVATQPFKESHFATMPPDLAETCIKAGCPDGGTVLDPFGGAGTTGLVADRLSRHALLIELNPTYAQMAARRIQNDNPMFAEVSVA